MNEPKVSVVVPCLLEELWQAELTRAVTNIAIMNTKLSFELIFASAVNKFSACLSKETIMFEFSEVHNPNKGNAAADHNRGMDAASGDIVVLLTNDVFVKEGWLEALLECFKIPDCGMASLGTSDHREVPTEVITEGLWCPLMALPNRPDFRFDHEVFPSYWGDSDLVMRVYDAGFRAYRNRRVVCDHLGRATNTSNHPQGREEVIAQARERFIMRHGRSNKLIYRVLMDGLII